MTSRSRMVRRRRLGQRDVRRVRCRRRLPWEDQQHDEDAQEDDRCGDSGPKDWRGGHHHRIAVAS